MPGIAGVVAHDGPANHGETVTLMLDAMMHEPFYATGSCCAPELGIWAGWVAHADSFAAHESGRTFERPLTLAFAGEAYDDASSAGFRHALDRFGENGVAELNGLFSGLLIDRRRARAWLFNDRFGFERIYLHETDEATYFASEAKALLRVLPHTRAFDDRGVAQFLTFGCCLDGQTLFRGITRLTGGSIWTLDGRRWQKRRYFTPAEWEQQPPLSVDEYQTEFEARFKTALPRYTNGTAAPLGISLTGGLDTRMIMACLPDSTIPARTYTFAGLHGDTLDARIAARVAAECGLEHRVLRIGADFLSDYGKYVERTVYATDACAGATGAHEIYLNAQARQLSAARLTGNFGSEVLRSMSTFKPLGLRPALVAEEFRSQFDAARHEPPPRVQSPVTFAAFQEIPWNLWGTWAAARSQLTVRTPYLDNGLVQLIYRAPANVRRTPDSALELIRTARPRLAGIPTDRGVSISGRGISRHLVSRVFAELTFKADYLYADALPAALSPLDAAFGRLHGSGILGLHKYLPYRRWFRNEVADYVRDAVRDASTSGLPFWNRTQLKELARLHASGRRNLVRELNAVLTLETASRLLLRGYTIARRTSDSVLPPTAPDLRGAGRQRKLSVR